MGHTGHKLQRPAILGLRLDIRPSREVLVRGDALNLPFADNVYSAVVLWQTMEHLPDPWQALTEVNRLFRPNGMISSGSVSFLDHDESFFGFTELGLRHVHDCGFKQIDVWPGISSFSLIAWTLMGRMANED